MQVIFAQANCNCDKSAAAQKYLAKVTAGGCEQCAQIALYDCLCNCETANETPERVEQMILQLGETIGNLRSQGISDCCPEYANLKKKCPNAGKKKSGGGSGSSGNSSAHQSPTMANINQNFVNFANMLAPFASSPEAVQMIKNINNIHTGAQVAKDILNAGGAGQKALNTVDNLEAIGQAGAVANALLQESPEMQQKRKEQEEATQYVNSLNSVVQDIYNKSSKAPEGYHSNNPSVEVLNAYEQQLNDYDNNTAMQRLLILRYNQYSEPPVISELKNMVSAVMEEQQQYGVEHIKSQIIQLSNPVKTKKHLMNSDKSFAYQKSEIEKRKKIQEYSQSGNTEQVNKLSEQLAKIKQAEENFNKYNSLAKKKTKSGIVLSAISAGSFVVGFATLVIGMPVVPGVLILASPPVAIIGVTKFIKAGKYRRLAKQEKKNMESLL